jgi:hypothetical protein
MICTPHPILFGKRFDPLYFLHRQSNYKVYAYIVKHNYILGGMLFTICKAQLHVSATNVGHLQIVNSIPPNI